MNNQLFITLDSLRWDVFEEAKTPFLKSLGKWELAYTQGTYTLPAHISFFAGKLPQTFTDENYYGASPLRIENGKRLIDKKQLWRLNNPETRRPAKHVVSGENIIEGFKKKGFKTYCIGGVNWFNPKLVATKFLLEHFNAVLYFGQQNISRQVNTVLNIFSVVKEKKFIFMNVGETHHPFKFRGCSWGGERSVYAYGDINECRRRQRLAIEFVDNQLQRLCNIMKDCTVVICADHGDCFGEDGIWGHSFYHPKVIQVPMLVIQ